MMLMDIDDQIMRLCLRIPFAFEANLYYAIKGVVLNAIHEEREACAKECDELGVPFVWPEWNEDNAFGARTAAATIRARRNLERTD